MSILYKDNYTLQKTKSYNKNCWSLIYNMNYDLKSRLHKSQIYKKKKKNQFWASCCTADVLWCNHSHPRHIFLTSWGWMFKRFSEVELYFALEVKVNFMARWAVLPHIISWCRILHRKETKQNKKLN